MTLPGVSTTTTLPRGQVRFPKGQGYGARVDELYVRLAPTPGESPVRTYTRDSLAPRQDQRGNIYENVLDIGYAWARTDWSGGEGLDWDPRDLTLFQGETQLDKVRFWDSQNVDVSREGPGDPYTLDLTRETVAWGNAVTDPRDLTVTQVFIYVADGTVISWYQSWDNLTAVAFDNIGTIVEAMAGAPNDGVMAIGADGEVYFKKEGLSTFVSVYIPTGPRPAADGVWYVKGRWIVTATNGDVAELLEMQPAADGLTATEVVIDTADGTFWSVVDSGPAIVAAVSDGTVRSYTPFIEGSDPSAVGQLIPRGRTDMPDGEFPYLLGDVAGTLMILTLADDTGIGTSTARSYTAEVLDARFDYTVGALQLKRTWFKTTDAPNVTNEMITIRDELFWSIHEDDGIEWVWRFDAVTTGLSRHIETGTDDLFSIVVFDQIPGGRTASEIRILASASRQSEGYIITPNISFGLNTDIAWISTVIEARNLEGGAAVELYRSTDPEAILDRDDPSWQLIRRITNDAQSGVEVPLVKLLSRSLAMKIEMFPSTDFLITPQVTRIGIRGIPTHRDLILELPINISDNIEVPGRRPVRIPNYGDEVHRELLNMVGQHIEVVVFDPPLAFRGIVDNILEPTRWISPRGSSGERAVMQLRGDRITATEVATGNEGLGLGLLGVAALGIGQTGVT